MKITYFFATSLALTLPLVALAETSPRLIEPKFRTVDMPEHIYSGEWEFFVGGGIAVFDCNGDGLPEIYAAGGEGTASLLVNKSTLADLVFTEETPQNIKAASVSGAYPIDIDSDGILDLSVLRLGQNMLMKGLGNCQFEPFKGLSTLPDQDKWTTAFSATWEKGSDLPTLAFGNYIDRTNPDGPFEACDTSELFRPTSKGTYDLFALDPGFCSLSMLFSDWGRTGRADLRVSNDRHYYIRNGSEQLWAMEAEPRLYTSDDGWNDYSLWGMGIASRDITGDGFPEVYLTSMGDQKLHSLTDTKRPSYDNAPYDRGVTAHRPFTGGDGRPSTGWHVAFGDVQNDGMDDIFVTKGNVEQMPSAAMLDPNNLLVAKEDGNFVERGDTAGVASLARSRGGALVDLNGDGLLDIVANNRRAPLEVFQNITQDTGSWLGVELYQDGANSFAVGAIVEVSHGDRVWTQELTIGGGHAGGVFAPMHFGLGASEALVDVTVIWPDQSQTQMENVALNAVLNIKK